MNIPAFYDQKDEHGVSNRDKIAARQRIIRRVSTTSKEQSYEAADGHHDGLVTDGEKIIGFGIHIFNENIYPLESFEIYLRNCDLVGELDLSGCEDLLFVDVYHNRISKVDVSGASSIRILGLQDNRIEKLDLQDLRACLGIDVGMNRLHEVDVSNNTELVELYVNDNRLSQIDLSSCSKLKYFYCHNNGIEVLDTRANPLLRHLNATGNPMKHILSLAPQRDEAMPLELSAGEGGYVGLEFNPVYNAQWKETGEWQQTYYAYPQEGRLFAGWYDTEGSLLSRDAEWVDVYGTSRIIEARFDTACNDPEQVTGP